MPILSVNPTKNNGASENIGITRYYDDVYFAGIRGSVERAKMER